MRVKAVRKGQWVTMLILGTVITCYLFSNYTTFPIVQKVILRFASIILTVISICKLIFSTILSEEGVYLYCFRNCIRYLPWNQVGQICEARDLPIAAKVSSPSYLLIVPQKCKKYSCHNTVGILYCLQNCSHIFRIDNSECNRQFIEHHFGEIMDEK